ncbi:hypothetical protein D3C72_1573540 [compost metagenome]
MKTFAHTVEGMRNSAQFVVALVVRLNPKIALGHLPADPLEFGNGTSDGGNDAPGQGDTEANGQGKQDKHAIADQAVLALRRGKLRLSQIQLQLQKRLRRGGRRGEGRLEVAQCEVAGCLKLASGDSRNGRAQTIADEDRTLAGEVLCQPLLLTASGVGHIGLPDSADFLDIGVDHIDMQVDRVLMQRLIATARIMLQGEEHLDTVISQQAHDLTNPARGNQLITVDGIE